MRADIIAAALTWEEFLDAMAAEEAGAITRCELTSLGLQDLPEPGPYGAAERRLDRHMAGAGTGEVDVARGRNESGASYDRSSGRHKRSVWTVAPTPFREAHFATFPPALVEPCILAGCPEGGTVLDPFCGAGTMAVVAVRMQRDAILCELNPAYAKIATRRLEADAGLFAQVAAE